MRKLIIPLMVAAIAFTIGIAIPLLSRPPALSKENLPVERFDSIAVGPQADELPNSTMGKSVGLVVLSRHYNDKDFIRFYNEDGSLWYSFTFYYDDSDGRFEYQNPDFRPFAFHVDYFLLALRCVKQENGRLEVVVNEETDLHKYVRADDPALRFETWEAHLLSVGAISFDQQTNRLRREPNGQEIGFAVNGDSVSPVELRGEWLKVKWKASSQTVKRGAGRRVGWIRWRNGKTLLVEFQHLC